MEQRYIVAVELSGSQIKGALASVDADGTQRLPEVHGVAIEDQTGCVQYGRVQNLVQSAKTTSFVIQKLENLPAIKGGKIEYAYVALAGRSLGSMQTMAELTMPTEMEVTEEIVRRLYKEASKPVGPDRKALKVMPRKFMIDNQPVTNPVGAIGTRLRGEFTVVTCSVTNHRNMEMVIQDRTNITVMEYVVTPLAIADMVLTDEERQLGCVLVDIGFQTTTMAIYKDRALQYLVTLPIGSNNITQDIATGLTLPTERAEAAKRAQGNALPETAATGNPDYDRINSYVQARVGEIVANVTAHIGFAKYKPADLAAGFVLTGRGAKLKNFDRFVEKQSKMKVRMASVPATINLAAASASAADLVSLMAVVYRGASATQDPSCIEFDNVVVEQQTLDIEQHRPDTQVSTASAGGFVPFDDTHSDDNWDIDDEEAERRAALRRKEAEREAAKEAERRRIEAERKAAAEAAEAERKAREEADIKPEKPSRKPGIGFKIRTFVSDIFQKGAGEPDDQDLDDDA